MKRLIYIALFIPFCLNGQNIKKIPRSSINDSRATVPINQAITQTNTNTTNISSLDDSITAHRSAIDSARSVFNYRDSTADINYIDWDMTDGWSQQEGRTGWNDDDKTLETGLDQNSVLQHGQEIHVRGVNKYGITLYNGTPVYISGAQGSRPAFDRANNTSISTSLTTIGLTTHDIENNTNGYVTITGIVRDIPDSMFITSDAITDGELLWLGAGRLTDTRPESNLMQIAFGYVINTQGSDVDIIINPVVVPRLAYLSDVDARGNQTDDQVLAWNSDSLEWESTDSLAVSAIYYKDTYWDDLRVPLTNTRINPVNTEPDFEDRGDGIFAWGFDSDSDSSYVLNYTAQTQHARKDSSLIEAHIHWQPDGTNTGNVVWKLVYSLANIDGTFTTPDTFRIVDAADGVALKHQMAEFGNLLGSDTMRISSAIMGSVARMGEAADDTYTGTAYGIELDFHVELDRPGSEEETTKY